MNIQNNWKMGRRIRQIRLHQPDPDCRTQVGFARRLGISQSSLSRFEHGTVPDMETLRKIAQSAGVAAEVLLAETAPSPTEPRELPAALTPETAFAHLIRNDPAAREVMGRHLREAVKEIDQSPRPETLRVSWTVEPGPDAYAKPAAWSHQWEAGRLPGELLAEAFPEAGSVVLDVGSGSGGNAATLLSLGYNAFGVEPSAGLREQALILHPELQGRLEERKTPGLGRPFERLFDGVLCTNVLQSIAREQLIQVGMELRAILHPGGRLLVSLPLAPPPAPKGQAPEPFFPIPPAGLQFLFVCLGFRHLPLQHIPKDSGSISFMLFEKIQAK